MVRLLTFRRHPRCDLDLPDVIEPQPDGQPLGCKPGRPGRSALTFVSVLVAVVFVFAQINAQKEVRKPDSRAPQSDTPLAVFKGLERAWNRADAQKISKYAGESRIFLEVRGIAHRGGYFSRSQVYYMFRDMFKANKHMNFEFVKFHTPDNPDRRVYGIAHRRYKNNRSGRLYQDKVYVTLKKEGSRWVVAEIKTTW